MGVEVGIGKSVGDDVESALPEETDGTNDLDVESIDGKIIGLLPLVVLVVLEVLEMLMLAVLVALVRLMLAVLVKLMPVVLVE